MNQRKGFTLIELLISVSIFAAVSIAVYATFSSGMNVWRRIKDVNVAKQRNLLRAEKLNRELRQAFSFKDIKFSGEAKKIIFAQIVNSEISRLTYSFDAAKEALLRGADSLPDVLSAKKENQALQTKLLSFLPNVGKAVFSYLYFDIPKNSYLWKDSWDLEILPLAVKIEMDIDGSSYTSIIFIPVA